MRPTDVAVVGAGIVGLATAHALLAARRDLAVVLLEKEDSPALHQTGRNSGVLHSGIYYRPGSQKATMATAGRRSMVAFCEGHGIRYSVCGKVIVATSADELPRLRALEERARANGVGVELIDAARLRELEPHAVGAAALHVPEAGVVDFREVASVLARLVTENGAEVRLGWTALGVDDGRVRTDQGEVQARVVVNCAGLHSDRLAKSQDVRIVPFRGEYYELVSGRDELVRHLIYPVPDPAFPFLGVHFTRGISGNVHAGPNAVLALAREGYGWGTVDRREIGGLVRFPGTWRLASHYWRTGLGEVYRSLSRSAFVRALQRLVPEVRSEDLRPVASGVRAQAVDRSGKLVDDFLFQESARAVHVLNAPSPAATASLEIGKVIAARVLERLD